MKNKTIYIINQYASTPEYGIGGRHYSFSKYLTELGHNVFLIMSSSNHLLHHRKQLDGDFLVEQDGKLNLVWIRTNDYSIASSRTRVFNWFKFSVNLTKLPSIINERPDVILYSSPSLLGYLGAYRLSKVHQAKLIFEVRDIWPLTLCQLGGFSRINPLIVALQLIEDFAYKSADSVISNLPNAVEHMVKRGLARDKFNWIPNGFSHSDYYSQEKLSEEYLSSLTSDNLIIGYCGTIGKANAIDVFIDAAEILKSENVRFIVVGSGSEYNNIKARIDRAHLKNVTIMPSVKKTQVSKVIEKFDVCYLGWHDKELYKYGIAANKLSEYMLSKKPILHSYSGKMDPVLEYDCGISVEAQNPSAVADAVMKLKAMTNPERDRMGKNGYLVASKLFNYKYLTKQLEKLMLSNHI